MLFSIVAKEIIVYVLFKPKATLRVGENTCNLATDKWLISKIYKTAYIAQYKKSNQIKNGQKT